VERQREDVEVSTSQSVEDLAENVRDACALLGTYQARFSALGFIP
jgi:hypothetical protein